MNSFESDDVLCWTSEKVGKWLSSIGLGDYVSMFLEENVTGVLLVELTSNELKDLGMSNSFHIKKLLVELRRFKPQLETDNEQSTKKSRVNQDIESPDRNALIETSLSVLKNVMFPNQQESIHNHSTTTTNYSRSSEPSSVTQAQPLVQTTNNNQVQVSERTTENANVSAHVEQISRQTSSRSAAQRDTSSSTSAQPVTQSASKQTETLSEIHTIPQELTVSVLTQPPFNWYWTKGVSNGRVDDSYYYVTKYKPDGSRSEDAAFDEAIRRFGGDKYVKIKKSSKSFKDI